MFNLFQSLGETLSEIPWDGLALFIGGGTAGGGLYKILQVFFKHKRETSNADQEVRSSLRDELRKDLEDLRNRLEDAEDEIQTWREKHFDLQEKYYELKRDYDDAKAQNEVLKRQVEKLRKEVNNRPNGG